MLRRSGLEGYAQLGQHVRARSSGVQRVRAAVEQVAITVVSGGATAESRRFFEQYDRAVGTGGNCSRGQAGQAAADDHHVGLRYRRVHRLLDAARPPAVTCRRNVTAAAARASFSFAREIVQEPPS
jgi:hypothetical protein